MKALVGAFNQEKALVGAFSVIVQPVMEPMEHYTALIRFRMREHEELLGADYVEHNVHRHGLGITRAVSVLGSKHADIVRGHVPVGKNKVLLLCIY